MTDQENSYIWNKLREMGIIPSSDSLKDDTSALHTSAVYNIVVRYLTNQHLDYLSQKIHKDGWRHEYVLAAQDELMERILLNKKQIPL